jgi:hypothetical protein
MKRVRALTSAVAMAALLGAATARAETSLYVVDQPELSFVIEAKGSKLYVAYLRAEILCYGAGSHWFEGPEAKTHRAFEVGPVKLQGSDGRLRLVRTRRASFGSSREAIRGEVQPESIVGTFSYFASGAGIGGSCEANAPGFEPQFGEREPPVPFKAQRYVALASPLATPPADPAAEALYFQSSRQLEALFWIAGGAVTRLDGAAREICTSREGAPEVRRRALEPPPPFPVEAGGGRFEARAGRDWRFEVAASRLEGTVDAEAVAGRYRGAIAYRESRKAPFKAWCRTGGRDGDGEVGYRATRYLPVLPAGSG